MWELDHKESWAPKNWCFQTVVVGKTLESFLDCREIKPVNPKGNRPCIFIGRTDAEAKAPILWLPDAKSWLIRKDPDVLKDWGQGGKRTTEDKMVGCHHRLNSHEFEQAPGDDEGQGGLACCSAWGCKELDTTGWLNNNSMQYVNCGSCNGSKESYCLSWKSSVLKHVLQGGSFLKVAHYFLNFSHYVLTSQRSKRPRNVHRADDSLASSPCPFLSFMA